MSDPRSAAAQQAAASKNRTDLRRQISQSKIDREEVKRGNAEVDPGDIMDVEEFYDSERLAINRVMAALNSRMGQQVEGSAFQREVRERFAEIGFVVRCDLYRDEADPRPWDERPWIPDIQIVGRTEAQGEFDHERMGHEVRSDILGKNQQGNVQRTQVAPGWSQSSSGLVVPD